VLPLDPLFFCGAVALLAMLIGRCLDAAEPLPKCWECGAPKGAECEAWCSSRESR
jgi:hypothetical protein